MELDERKMTILRAIIQNYLETGEPVGSRTISKYTDLNLSSATIRNEMSDLEEMGYIVQPHTSLTIGRNPNYYRELDKDDIRVESYDNCSRQIPGTDGAKKLSFRDAKLPFTKEQVEKETGRCLSCGATIVDENQCVGCGLCTTRCEFDAIHLHRDNPECSTMRKSEDKLKYVLPYGLKQAIKVRFKGKKEPDWR